MRAFQPLFAVVACIGLAPTLGQAPVTKKSSSMCPGAVDLAGYGKVAMTAAGWAQGSNGSKLQVTNDSSDTGVTVFTNARAYFANTCEDMSYHQSRYLALNLLGKTMRYTTDISGTGCGCNAAMYLVSMPQNKDVSACGDYYCDANAVCGKSCTEIDIQEANQHAWHSTLHTSHDREGLTGGYGGGGANWTGPRTFTVDQYSPGGRCVDTAKPFDVSVSFPVDSNGSLTAMMVKLSQEGKSCSLEIDLSNYNGNRELEQALIEGMTPVVSYWHSEDMLWMDGKGLDEKGPCTKDRVSCAESIRFYDFEVAGPGGPESFLGESATRTASGQASGNSPRCARSTDNCRTFACCSDPGTQCYEKNRDWSGCRESCIQEFSADGWTCKRLGPRTPQNGWDANHPPPSMASTTRSQGDIGKTAGQHTAHKDKGETVVRHRGTTPHTKPHSSSLGSHSTASSPLKLLAAAALVVLPSLAAVAWFVHRMRQDSSRDVVRNAQPERPSPCTPCAGERWNLPQQPGLPPARASQTVFDTWDSHTTRTRDKVFKNEEEPSTWQQLQALFSGCSLGKCGVRDRNRQMEPMQMQQLQTRPRTASTMPLIR